MQTIENAKIKCLWKYGNCLDGVDVPICVTRMSRIRLAWCGFLSRCGKSVDGNHIPSVFVYKGVERKGNLCYGEAKDFMLGWNYIPKFTLPSELIYI